MSVVNRAVGADLAEIEAVYRCRLAELQRVATAITGSREGGRDVVQDAFARAVHRRARFRREGSLEGWIWRIVVSSARDGVRRLAATQALPLEEGEDGWSAGGTSAEEYEEVRGLIARLPERQRLVLFLRYYADLDYAMIAEALAISGGTVGATLNQAREALLQMLTEVKK
jgi:RNA polymerase sigma-70 factor (ECF subfamily)